MLNYTGTLIIRCYESLTFGSIEEAFTDLTGFHSCSINIHDRDGAFGNPQLNKTPDEFYEILKSNLENRNLLGCSATGDSEGMILINNTPTGLLSGHAYSLLDYFEVPKPNGRKRQISRLLKLRNPWGNSEWDGKWSDSSEEATKNKEAIMNIEKTEEGILKEDCWNPDKNNDGSSPCRSLSCW